jgi:hypothetical protein
LSGEKGRLRPFDERAALPLNIFVIGTKQPAEILAEYARITGLRCRRCGRLDTRQSHRTLDSPEEIFAQGRIFREKRLPCDAMVYLGTGFCPKFVRMDMRWNNGTRTLELRLARGARMLRPELLPLEIKLAGSGTARTTVFNGTAQSVKI